MKNKIILISVSFLSLFILTFITAQTINQAPLKAASGTEKIVELYIEGCD